MKFSRTQQVLWNITPPYFTLLTKEFAIVLEFNGVCPRKFTDHDPGKYSGVQY